MYKVIVTNLLNNTEFGTTAETIELAEQWVNDHPFKGNDYTVEYIPLEDYQRPQKLEELKRERDKILCATDWLFIPDVKNISQKSKKIYMEYRQYLRELPDTLRINPSLKVNIEPFENWLRRNYPEEFMDGGNQEKIIKKFKYYI